MVTRWELRFDRLCEYFEKLENTQSRNEMTDILAELFQEAGADEIREVCYFLTGEIAPGYKDVQLGMGDELTKSALSIALNVDEVDLEERLRETGDLGDVVSKVHQERILRSQEDVPFKDGLTVEDVHQGFMKIANASGRGSQEIKKTTLGELLSRVEVRSRRYIIRLTLGQMRLGVGDMTVLDGLAVAFLGSKKKRPPLEHAYNVSSDLGHVARVLAKSGLDGIGKIRVSIDRPIRPQLAQRVDQISQIPEKIGSKTIAVEKKYDGERIQAHKKGGRVTLFSRRLNNVTHQFPDISESVTNLVEAESAILDGEAVAYNFEEGAYYSFQKLMRRRRKYRVEEYSEEVPVKYMVFDLLYINGNSLLRNNYMERTDKLRKITPREKYIAATERVITQSLEEIDDYFQMCIREGLEGVICKSMAEGTYYRAGAREWSWIKWKPSYASELSDTLDLVVVGAYSGKGSRGGTYGSLLCACYNRERDVFQTVCKLGTGFTEEELQKLPDKLADARVEKKPARVEVSEELKPDYWFAPKYILEVRGSELTESPIHSCNWSQGREKGLSLRFPRFEGWRPDRSEEQATTSQEIRLMVGS